MKPRINAAYAAQGSLEESEKISRVKQLNNKYIKEVLNDYERSVITALNDWHAPQLRNALAYKDKVSANCAVNEFNTTFLHYAASKQDSRSDTGHGPLEILILAGADIFAQDENGLMPFDYAKLKNNTINALIIQKEFDHLTRRFENKRSILEKIRKGAYVVATHANKDEVAKMNALLEVFKNNINVHQKQKNNLPLNAEEAAIAQQMSAYLPVISEEEVLNMEAAIKEFEGNSVLYKERLESYKEPRPSGPSM